SLMLWNWQQPDWPEFRYLSVPLHPVRPVTISEKGELIVHSFLWSMKNAAILAGLICCGCSSWEYWRCCLRFANGTSRSFFCSLELFSFWNPGLSVTFPRAG